MLRDKLVGSSIPGKITLAPKGSRTNPIEDKGRIFYGEAQLSLPGGSHQQEGNNADPAEY
jgi:hypothetical protein